jgi:hypothetical protein
LKAESVNEETDDAQEQIQRGASHQILREQEAGAAIEQVRQ